jgi:hypothetical protein
VASRHAWLQSRGKEEQLRGRSSQRDLGSETASPATAAAARQRDSPASASFAQPDGAGTSRAGAAAVAGRGRASQEAASSFPAAGRRAPTPDIAAAERLGRRLAEVAEATVAALEAPLILSQKEKEAGLPVSQRQRQRQCCRRRADWRQRQEQWQRTMCIGGKLLRAAVAPNLRYKRRFPAHGCACPNAALSSLVLLACSTAPCPRYLML